MEINFYEPNENLNRKKKIKINASVLEDLRERVKATEKELARVYNLERNLYRAFLIIETLEKALESSKKYIFLENELEKLEQALAWSKKYMYENQYLKERLKESVKKHRFEE